MQLAGYGNNPNMCDSYTIIQSEKYKRSVKRLPKSDDLIEALEKCYDRLHLYPYYNSLNTRKKTVRPLGIECMNSNVTGNYRIAWDFAPNCTIVLFYCGDHNEMY